MGRTTRPSKPWERQTVDGKLESPEAYAAFCVYRDLGPKRALSDVIGGLSGNKRAPGAPYKKAPGRIYQWSVKWNWVARANAWDDEVDRQRREAQAEEAIRMGKRQATQAESATTVLLAASREVLRRLQSDPNALAALDIGDLLTMASHAARSIPLLQKAERMARLGGEGLLPPVDLSNTEEYEEYEVEWGSESGQRKAGGRS